MKAPILLGCRAYDDRPDRGGAAAAHWRESEMPAAHGRGTFRDRIRLLRGRSGLTQRELAALLGVSRQALQKWEALVSRYGGNPLALTLVGQAIAELFGGAIDAFWGYALKTGGAVFGEIRLLLEEQVTRLSPLEQSLLYWLAVEREPVSVAALRADSAPGAGPGEVLEALEALEALGQRSLLLRCCCADAGPGPGCPHGYTAAHVDRRGR
jgi:transcriptional regulator with XRE-family HTH domain